MLYSSLKLFNLNQPILIFGRDGQIGKSLQEYFNHLKVPVIFLGRLDCDLSDELAIKKILNHYSPSIIINAAAYTEVDKAESEIQLAFAVNAKAPEVMARYIANVPHGILVHYSTDYVFGDTKKTAYFETDSTGPIEKLSIYGQSKLAGEKAVEEVFNFGQDSRYASAQDNLSRYFILRTSWVYGDGGNFILTMLRLAAEKDQLRVVCDQLGVPTSAKWLAEIGVQIANSKSESGIYHAVPDGKTSWYELAIFIIEVAASVGRRVKVNEKNIFPIPAIDYPLPAKRPYNSSINNSKLKRALSKLEFSRQYPHWQEQVEDYVRHHVIFNIKN
ncbi:dTDP-4-dehydrorhamnose reductase [Polynucleobacter sp. AM-26B4]|uniref:dTDP-4-dehydrorhamnose reductase n=1 Tax=Polynucleobacter sp. AM-26B4 TaxID=2689103 RepID=UPI001C0D3F40|nr:dTDP-4-dehydrorhamnose reductase [Polynucleobacter sp. AM-26B4]MBU3585123.1 dTDP-4-dehydrorhamnose reductase [Polynucleobacter sp. AM-26B4]